MQEQEQTHINQIIELNKLLMEMVCELQKEVKELKNELKPAIKFFKEKPEETKQVVKRLSKKEKFRLEIEEHSKMLELQSYERIKKANMG